MKLIIASNNEGKIREIKKILEPLGYEVLSQKEANIDLEVEETGKTYEENATLKAEAIYNITKANVLSDDSGLSIDYFDGAPGLYSARFKPYLSSKDTNEYILHEMEKVKEEDRKASFVCCLCFIKENGEKIIVEETCEGRIAYEQKGNNGFGYDPIFFLQEYGKTMAEIPEEEKNKISHRAKALKVLREKLV